MPVLLIQLKKGRDGPSVLTCVRPDGTRTWNRLHPFHPVHDLLHYAVESTLGIGGGFFGLIARGWSIPDFAAPGASDRMGDEAAWAESMVGQLDRERATGDLWSARDFNEGLRLTCAQAGRPYFRAVTDVELDAVRALHADLAGRWRTLAPGDTLELPFVSR